MRENIILILADQLRASSLSHASRFGANTPNIDRMAEEGFRFTNSVSVYPICVPARFSMFQGSYPHSRFIPGIEWRISPAERTVAHDVNEAGYQSCYIGKWHLYGGHGVLPGHTARKANRTAVPRAFQGGFTHWRGFDVANAPFDTCYFVDDDPEPKRLNGFQTDGLTDLAIEQIRTLSRGGSPFFLVLSVEPPHFPLDVKQEDLDRVCLREELPDNFLSATRALCLADSRAQEDREALIAYRRRYDALVENFDRNVGRLQQVLRELGLEASTNLILTSDHGQMEGAHSIRNIRKSYPFSESVDVPLIICGPAVPKGSRGNSSDTPVSTLDIVPTICQLAGTRAQESQGRMLSGSSLVPMLSGEKLERDSVYFEYCHDLRASSPFHGTYWRGVRTEEWTYIVRGDAEGSSPWYLFDRKKDPYELDNLIDDQEYRSQAVRLHGLLVEHHRDSGDHFVLSGAYGYRGANEWIGV